MKRWEWSLGFAVLFVGVILAIVVGLNNAHTTQIREEGQRVIMDAVARMERVASGGDMDALLSACEAGSGGKVSCRQTDYDVTYRGHRILASNIAIDYHRLMHDKWDATNQRYLPYLTANVHLERRPRLHYYGLVAN